MVSCTILLVFLRRKLADDLNKANRMLAIWQGIAVATSSAAEQANRRTLLMHALVEDMAAGRAEDTAMASIMGITTAAKVSLPHTHVLNLFSDALYEGNTDETRLDEVEKLEESGTRSMEALIGQDSALRSLRLVADSLLYDSDTMEKDAWIYSQIGMGKESV